MAMEHLPNATEQVAVNAEVLSDVAPFCLTIMGFTGTDNRVRSIGGMLSAPEMYGEGNAKVWDSYLSWDQKDPQRYDQMADDIGTALSSGRRLDALLYSFGSVEFLAALDTLQKRDPEAFAQLPFYNLNIIHLSPSGLFNGIGSLNDYRKRLGQMKEGVEDPRSAHESVDSTVLLPPDGIADEIINDALRRAYPQQSQIAQHPDLSVAEFAHPVRDYHEGLTPEQVEMVARLDVELARAIEQEDWTQIAEVLGRKSETLGAEFREAVYSGSMYIEPKAETPQMTRQLTSFIARGLLGMNAKLIRTFLRGGLQDDEGFRAWKKQNGHQRPTLTSAVTRNYQYLASLGASTWWFVPEYDYAMPYSAIAGLPHDIVDPEHVIVLERLTHASITPQPEASLRNAFKRMREQIDHS